jgi:integrase
VVTKVVTELKVIPSDWLINPSSIHSPWQIWYRYNGKLVKIMRMNREKDYQARVEVTKQLIKEEEEKIKQFGFNPLTKTYQRAPKQVPLIALQVTGNNSIGFIAALQMAFDQLKREPGTLMNIKSCLKYVSKAAELLGIHELPVIEIRKKHIKILLSNCKGDNISPRTWNVYRSYLMILFEELDELELVEHNPAKEIKKKKEDVKIRLTLTDEERELVKKHLQQNYPDFYRFVQIFFHSGGRRSELLNLRVRHVNLERGEYLAIVKKGNRKREVIRVIKDVALPYWKELLGNNAPDDFVFSIGLKPGAKKIREEQVTRRWRRLVKEKLGIEADLYSLKHLNTDETAALLNIDAAAAHNGHTSTTITKKHYAFGEEKRQREKLRKVNNEL